jgi:hypothetical protein
MVEQMVEFNCLGTSFVGSLHSAARRQGMRVTARLIARDHAHDMVVFQAYDPEGLWKPNMYALPKYRELCDRLGLGY